MARESALGIQRSRTSIDTSVLRSKTGLAILKGGKFYDQSLSRRVLQLSNDAKVEIRIWNYKQRLFVERRNKSMKRSENLVKTYNLPPLKTNQLQHRHQTNSKSMIPDIITDSKVKDKPKGRGIGGGNELNKLDLNDENFDSDDEDIRNAIFSPIPQFRNDDDPKSDGDVTSDIKGLNLNSTVYPFITVDACEESLPPVQKRPPTPPEYSLRRSESRTGSSNSLGVPSPITQRRALDGKLVNLISRGNAYSKFSSSEGSIPDALKTKSCTDDPRFKALEAVLRPGKNSKAGTRTPTKIDIAFDRARSTSNSPATMRKGRLLRRDDERQHWKHTNLSKTPP